MSRLVFPGADAPELAAGVRVAGARFRAECAEQLGGLEPARAAMAQLVPVAVPHRDQEFHAIFAPQPRVGYAACPPPLR